jgi:ribose transport system permease protein
VSTGADAKVATDRQGRLRPASLLTNALVGAGFLPVWIASAAMIVIAAIIASETLGSDSLSAVLPGMAVLAVAALGEMLVIMMGGIDLSIPGTMTIAGLLTVGVSGGDNSSLAAAIVVCLAWSALIGFGNGLLIGVVGLNPLIVTLAVGWIVLGISLDYSYGIANESSVPSDLSSWATDQFLGASWFFWVGVAITVLLALCLRYTAAGRRFQAVGANPRAGWIMGIHVRSHVVFAYTLASVLYGTAGILLAGIVKFPSLDLGAPYLLGPIAAVVIGGASLAGGRASATSTWAAAFGLTLLSQMLRVLNLSTALQYVVFGVAIAAGMVISGDRIVGALGLLVQRPGIRARIGVDESD